MQNRLAWTIGGTCALLWSAWAGGACGGRFAISEDAGGGGMAGSSAGSASSSGSSSSGGAPAQAGASSCVEPCPSCASGMAPVTLPGTCCPACVPDPVPSTCVQGQANYATLTQQLVAKFHSLPCTTTQDCTLVALSNACTSICQTFGVVSSESDSLLDALSQAAAADCATCPAPPANGCVGIAPTCIAGHCSP